MPDLRTTLIKKAIAPVFANWHRGTVEEQRVRQEKLSRFKYLPAGVTCETTQIGTINAERVKPGEPAGTILYLHGGAYTLGSIKTHRTMAATLANTANMQVLLIEYGRAPEDPFPAGLEDAVSAYLWLLEGGISPSQLMIAGDSAGGGLALATLLKLRDDGHPIPAGGILLSPWTNLTMSGESVQTRAHLDFILNAEHLSRMARLYAGDHELDHPLISPVYADLSNLPPLLIQVGTDEILLDDATRVADLAKKACVHVQLEIYEEMFHVFQMFPFFKEPKAALQSIAEFCQNQVSPDPVQVTTLSPEGDSFSRHARRDRPR